MLKRKIFILLGCEDTDTSAGKLVSSYEKGAKDAGHEVRRTNICDVKFDPMLHKGYKVIQELEPDLKKVQEDIRWADHFVVVYPNWWSTMPAVLKGLFDRIWLPGFAFHFHKGMGYSWDKLLKGKSAHVMITMNANPILERLAIGDYTNEIRRGILRFAGFSPVSLSTYGPVEKVKEHKMDLWMKKVEKLGRAGQ
jgi:putative NADPH-quinone reductase